MINNTDRIRFIDCGFGLEVKVGFFILKMVGFVCYSHIR